jgi:hypothetical protein
VGSCYSGAWLIRKRPMSIDDFRAEALIQVRCPAFLKASGCVVGYPYPIHNVRVASDSTGIRIDEEVSS